MEFIKIKNELDHNQMVNNRKIIDYRIKNKDYYNKNHNFYKFSKKWTIDQTRRKISKSYTKYEPIKYKIHDRLLSAPYFDNKKELDSYFNQYGKNPRKNFHNNQ